MRIRPLSALLAASVLLSFNHTTLADDVAMPSGAAATASVNAPQRGITMSKVEAKFGAPAERHAAVGQPPITRWDYPQFSVYFEHDHVIHSVIK